MFVIEFDFATLNLAVLVEKVVTVIIEHTDLKNSLILEEELLSAIWLLPSRWIRLHETDLEAHPFKVRTAIQNPSLLHEFFCGQYCIDLCLNLLVRVSRNEFIVLEYEFCFRGGLKRFLRGGTCNLNDRHL